jgi:hypothetical protein
MRMGSGLELRGMVGAASAGDDDLLNDGDQNEGVVGV